MTSTAFGPMDVGSNASTGNASMQLPVTIRASVGAEGVNIHSDVKAIQEALNGIPPASGGPSVALVPDGSSGHHTRTAIRNFQLFHFRWADGRVDTWGDTLKKINALLAPANAGPPTSPAPLPHELPRARKRPKKTPQEVSWPPDLVAIVTLDSGDALIQQGTDEFRLVEGPGYGVRRGARVITNEGRVTIRYKDGARTEVGPYSLVIILGPTKGFRRESPVVVREVGGSLEGTLRRIGMGLGLPESEL